MPLETVSQAGAIAALAPLLVPSVVLTACVLAFLALRRVLRDAGARIDRILDEELDPAPGSARPAPPAVRPGPAEPHPSAPARSGHSPTSRTPHPAGSRVRNPAPRPRARGGVDRPETGLRHTTA